MRIKQKLKKGNNKTNRLTKKRYELGHFLLILLLISIESRNEAPHLNSHYYRKGLEFGCVVIAKLLWLGVGEKLIPSLWWVTFADMFIGVIVRLIGDEWLCG